MELESRLVMGSKGLYRLVGTSGDVRIRVDQSTGVGRPCAGLSYGLGGGGWVRLVDAE